MKKGLKKTLVVAILLSVSMQALADLDEADRQLTLAEMGANPTQGQEAVDLEPGRIEAAQLDMMIRSARGQLNEKVQELVRLINENPENNAKIGTEISTVNQRKYDASLDQLIADANTIDGLIQHVKVNAEIRENR